MKKRTLSFFLCLVMVISLFVQVSPAAAAAESEAPVSILRDGEPVSEISIAREEKTTLTASFAGAGDCRWQILLSAESDQWVDIYDKTAPDCEVSYALVKNLLDDSQSAYLRCAVTGEATVYSDPVCVTVLPGEQSGEESAAVEPVLTEALTLLMPATAGVEERVGDEVLQGELPRPEEDSAPATEFAPTAEEEAVAADVAAFLAGLDVAPEEEITVDAQAPVLYDNGDGTEETDYVTITINYYDYLSAYPTEPAETLVKKEVYSPYVATLPYGAAFTQTVVSPTYLGFAPYYDPDGGENITTDASKIELSYAENVLTEDVSFDVYYKAIPVPYGIRYFFQNVNDDMYSENIGLYRTDKAETGTIVSDEKLVPTPESLAQTGVDLEGFEKLYHYPTAVAADGSTVFECYYDRNYYLIQFDLDGGYGVDPIYARYDAAIAVNDPTRHGYNFAGWKLTGIDTNHDGDWEPPPADMNVNGMIGNIPAYDCLYTAQWETVNTTYTVVYWRENADDNGYSYWGSKQRNAMSATTVDGGNTAAADGMTDAQYFTYNDARTDKDVLVEGDGSTVVNVYYTRNFYTITFEATGKCAIEENHVHGDACYDYICSYAAHVHDASCGEGILSCGLTEHKSHTAACITCGKTEHSHTDACCSLKHIHTTDCYNGKSHGTEWVGDAVASNSNNLVDAPSNPVDGQVYRRSSYHNSYDRVIYISGTWYEYNRWVDSGDTVQPTDNCPGAHTHNSGSCVCKDNLEEHAHTAACYGDTLHTHTAACYTYPNCSVPAHTHTDACKRLKCGMPTGHTHSNSCNNSSYSSVVYILTAKYQQIIGDIWPTLDKLNTLSNVRKNSDGNASNSNNQTFRGWDIDKVSNEAVSKRINMTEDLCNTDEEENNTQNASATYGGDYTYRLYYMFESFDQESDASGNERREYGNTYYDSSSLYYQQLAYSSNTTFSQKQITGMKPVGVEKETNNGIIYNFLYYDREISEFSFHNIDKEVASVSNVMYDYPLEDIRLTDGSLAKSYVPAYPDTLEPNAYAFAGWYTTPECFDGTEMNWADARMPNADLTLFAKWAPVTHTVNFFRTAEDMEAYEAAQEPKPYAVRTAEHGQIITQQVDDPTKTDEQNNALVFAGWFYIQNGAEKAYTPLSMPVNRDLNVYAKWSSHMPQPYRISYVLKGTDTKVADDTYGFAYNGTTRTFSAKAGDPYNQLYAGYNEGYFPTVGSHSITMAVEHDLNEDGKIYYDDVVQNCFTFEYVQANEISYRVEYRDATTGAELNVPAYKTTKKAVVTERFVPIEDHTPDAIYKKLVLEVEYDEEQDKYVGTENNVIIFYYSKANVGRVAVHHNVEELTDGQYTEYAYEEVTGNNDNTIYVDTLKIPGFALSDVKPAYYELRDKQGNITIVEPTRQEEDGIIRYPVPVNEFGTELYIYYDRLSYPYVVHYYEYNTTTSLQVDKFSAAAFGAEVEEEAIKIEGYTCVSQTTQTITVRQETDTNNDGVVDKEDTIANNVITFYYSPAKYTVKYVNTTPGGGVLSLEQEIVTGSMDFTGSKPTAGAYYRFDGWYLDEACTQAVNSDAEGTTAKIGEDMTLVPVKAKLSDTEDNIFYAKFERLTGPLTIARTSTDDTDRVFVYDILNNETNEVITVTVKGVGETTIPNMPLGDYTVTQRNDWSWRYSDVATKQEHKNTEGTTYTFGGSASASWLDGVSELIKNVKGG